MKIREKNYLGDEKIVKKFLIFPFTIDGETRWLEVAKIKYLYVKKYGYNYYNELIEVYPYYRWEPVAFMWGKNYEIWSK